VFRARPGDRWRLNTRGGRCSYLTLLCFVMGITQLYAWFNLNTIFFKVQWVNYIFVGANFSDRPWECTIFIRRRVTKNFSARTSVRSLHSLPGVVMLRGDSAREL
jgi:hypothetical protein